MPRPKKKRAKRDDANNELAAEILERLKNFKLDEVKRITHVRRLRGFALLRPDVDLTKLELDDLLCFNTRTKAQRNADPGEHVYPIDVFVRVVEVRD